MREAYVYIMSNKTLRTLYVGLTSDLEKRVLQHKIDMGSKFTKKYKLTKLIYLERFNTVIEAIERVKQSKNWHRDWKWNLIRLENTKLVDISSEWYDEETLKQVHGDGK